MFGTSGVRGELGSDVTAELALHLGRALASDGYDHVVVGRDPRAGGRLLVDALAAGVRECGGDVTLLGLAASPTVARAVGWLGADAGATVTASHNPPGDNGVKLWGPSGRAFDGSRQAAVARRVRTDDYALQPWDGLGTVRGQADLADRHVSAVVESVGPVADLEVAVDVGNGAGGLTADALDRLGCSVTTLHARPDGRFPGRPSEPTAEHCRGLRAFVAGTDADLGVAHDGDADRTLAVTGDGEFVPGDVLLALFGREAAGDGDRVAAPLNASLAVADALDAVGADLERTRVGDVHVAETAGEPGVVFGGEPSGAWIWPDETACPDGVLAAARLAALVGERGPLGDLVGGVETYPIRRESVAASDPEAAVDRVRRHLAERYEEVDCRDGARVEDRDGWLLVRASGTEPLVRVTAEARTERRADRLFEVATGLASAAADREDAGGAGGGRSGPPRE